MRLSSLAGTYVFLLTVTAHHHAAAGRPNILFIFTDDHAQHAISCYGSKVNTAPHLDRLAAANARFTNSFVTYHWHRGMRQGWPMTRS